MKIKLLPLTKVEREWPYKPYYEISTGFGVQKFNSESDANSFNSNLENEANELLLFLLFVEPQIVNFMILIDNYDTDKLMVYKKELNSRKYDQLIVLMNYATYFIAFFDKIDDKLAEKRFSLFARQCKVLKKLILEMRNRILISAVPESNFKFYNRLFQFSSKT